MKFLLSVCVALVTLFASVTADAQSLRWRQFFDFGGRPGHNAQDNWFYNQTTRRFNHPDVQNHLWQRINHRSTEFFTENGLTGNGELRWFMEMDAWKRHTSWSSRGEVTRVCRSFAVRFVISYRQWDSHDRRYYDKHTSVHGTLCSPDNGRTWYQEADFSVRF